MMIVVIQLGWLGLTSSYHVASAAYLLLWCRVTLDWRHALTSHELRCVALLNDSLGRRCHHLAQRKHALLLLLVMVHLRQPWSSFTVPCLCSYLFGCHLIMMDCGAGHFDDKVHRCCRAFIIFGNRLHDIAILSPVIIISDQCVNWAALVGVVPVVLHRRRDERLLLMGDGDLLLLDLLLGVGCDWVWMGLFCQSKGMMVMDGTTVATLLLLLLLLFLLAHFCLIID